MEPLQTAPVLSTPSEPIFEGAASQPVRKSTLSEDQLDIQYEIRRTVEEIRQRRWRRIALQFPDNMLVDAPRVLVRLRDNLRAASISTSNHENTEAAPAIQGDAEQVAEDLTELQVTQDNPIKLTILGDTSYGACCVDEIAAEHAAADGVVHYGRSCLSPTQRLPVIYVFSAKPISHEKTLSAIRSALPDMSSSICLLADVPWQHALSALAESLTVAGYSQVYAPDLVHDPSSIIPNRALPSSLQNNLGALQQTAIFHIGPPPTALLLTLSSRTKSIHIYDPDDDSASASSEAASSMMLRRRYASLLKLSSASVIGILINTLSVKNYLSALNHVQSLIAAARKKSYVFVVGKLNPAKLANFAEVDGWVVVGCWESSLIDSKEFLAPVVTPFELELALMKDEDRLWGHEWISDFQTLLQRRTEQSTATETAQTSTSASTNEAADDDQLSDDVPPEFDLRTGRYISHARPMAARIPIPITASPSSKASNAIARRAESQLATVNNVASPGAEYLRSKREWQGLGSDFEVAYDRDEHGNIQGALMEQGREGVAKGYKHSDADTRT